MWRKLRRTTMAPRRPAVFPEQWPLAILSVAALLGGIAVVVYALVR